MVADTMLMSQSITGPARGRSTVRALPKSSSLQPSSQSRTPGQGAFTTPSWRLKVLPSPSWPKPCASSERATAGRSCSQTTHGGGPTGAPERSCGMARAVWPGAKPNLLATRPHACALRVLQHAGKVLPCSPLGPVVHAPLEQAACGTVDGGELCVRMAIVGLIDLGIDHDNSRSVTDADLADTWGQSARHFVGDRAWDAGRDGEAERAR